jgi:hypothetical protein
VTVLAGDSTQDATGADDPGVSRWWHLLEVPLLALAPLLAVLVLHLRLMAPPALPDPAMHSVYIWDPTDLVRRYAPSLLGRSLRDYIGPPAAYFRWGTRPGFLVPARLSFLAFGTFPGFLVFRYALALIAIVPAYLLGKRSYGGSIGAVAVCLVLASPVVVTAWGTDFPDSAAVSYLVGGFACLLMPTASDRARRGWLLVAAVLLTAAVWSLATTGLLVAVAVVVVAVQTAVGRGWAVMLADLLWLAIGAVATTLALGVGSWLVLGRFDYVVPTLQAVRFLATPAQTRRWHSANWRWVLDDPYLLVLPATCLAWAVLAVRRRLPTPAITIGAVATLQLTVAAIGQFAGKLQLLENHYLSSPMWAASLLTLTVVIAELTRPLAVSRVLRWLPVVLVIAVALVSEITPDVPSFSFSAGVALAVVVVAGTGVAAWFPRPHAAPGPIAAVAVLAVLLALTVTPNQSAASLPGTVFDPPTGYQDALGGSSRTLVDDYRLEQEARHVIPNATYHGEQLLDCVSGYSSLSREMVGMFHNSINDLHDRCPRVGVRGMRKIRRRNAAQIVYMTPDRHLRLRQLMEHLAPVHPRIARVARLRSGSESVQLAVIDLPAALGPHHEDPGLSRRTAAPRRRAPARSAAGRQRPGRHASRPGSGRPPRSAASGRCARTRPARRRASGRRSSRPTRPGSPSRCARR